MGRRTGPLTWDNVRVAKSSLRNRRANLMAADPHCQNCGTEVVWYEPGPRETLPDNFATIEHVNSRNQLVRDPVTGRLGRPRDGKRVLWCNRCNRERNYAEVAAIAIEVRRIRSRRRGRSAVA